MDLKIFTSLNQSQKKLIIISIFLLIIGFIGFEFLSNRFTIAFTKPNQVCFPYKVWLINKTYKKINMFTYGDYIAFRSVNIPYVREDVVFVKKIIGFPGDIVETRINTGEKKEKLVLIDNNFVLKDIRAVVFVKNKINETYLLDVFATDSKNRSIPVINSTIIPEGKIFAFSPHERSYDSRYWGLIDESQIVGKAYPIF